MDHFMKAMRELKTCDVCHVCGNTTVTRCERVAGVWTIVGSCAVCVARSRKVYPQPVHEEEDYIDRCIIKKPPKVRRPVITFVEAVALLQGKGEDYIPTFLKPDDTAKGMLKKLREHDMRDRIDNIFRYRKAVCGEDTYDLSSIEDDLVRVYEGSGYKENPWYALYKLLKIRYGYKIKLTNFPNLTANKNMKAEYDRCF